MTVLYYIVYQFEHQMAGQIFRTDGEYQLINMTVYTSFFYHNTIGHT